MLRSSSRAALAVLVLASPALPAVAQPLLKSAVQVDPGNTRLAGQTFGYRLTYNCSSTSGPCVNAEVVDLLPPEVELVSTVPAGPAGDVAAIETTPNFGGTGRTRVRFQMIDPLPAGNSGDLLINVRFPNGSTPDGTTATNTADATNLETAPGTFTTPPVAVTAAAGVQVSLAKTLTTSPAHLDMAETYRLRITVPNLSGALDLTAIGPVVDTLPPGTVFNGATPAADCQPGCVGTTPATVTWSNPCALPLEPGESCDVTVNVTFPSATFPSGTEVTNQFTADATPLGEPQQSFGPEGITHPVTTFVPVPSAALAKNVTGGSPNPPTLNQGFTYEIVPRNDGNVPLDNLVMIDVVPVELQVTSVTTGAYSSLADFAVGVGVRVSYEKNTAPGVFWPWGSSSNTGANTTLTAPPPGLAAGEHITRIRWEYGQALPGMAPTSAANRPQVRGQIINPDNAGLQVAFGDTVENCVGLTAVYAGGPANVAIGPVCRDFVVSGPFVQLNPAKERDPAGGPLVPGEEVGYRLRVRSDARSSDPLPLGSVVATDLLPVHLEHVGFTFDDRGTGLPGPQVFELVENFAGTGRQLLRWRWTAGSGNLDSGDEVWIRLTTRVRSGAPAGALVNDFTLHHEAPGIAQRCTGASQADALDLDGDSDTAETLCRESEAVSISAIAQLVSAKTVAGTCDGGFVSTSAGTLAGGAVEYRLAVQNVGTVAMQSFVLVDVLPFVGDTGVRDTSPRGSQWTPLLAAPITPPAGTTLYYSTSGNPCRGEVGGPVTGCDPPGWTTVPPEPITSARAFKIEFGNRVVQPFDFVEVVFALTAPGDLAPGLPAFNSFAYQAQRADGLGALAAEPQKVGIALGDCEAAALGDRVWVDVDGEGTQDDGPTGLDGVPVRLFAPGADGLGGTADDVLLAAPVTGPSPGGEPGWYRFPGLAPGAYRVCVAPPPTFVLTAPSQGGDAAADSNGDPATGCAPLVVLAADEDRPDVDFGLVATGRAALGDRVWFDRDGDGVQDESTFDGVNGVLVRLFVDDGDGVPDPGGDDVLVASTVTADDLDGHPGAYLFDGLVPGLPYFVQFVQPPAATGWTTADAGGDDAADSDASPASGVTPVVTLAPGEVDRTFDAGLLTPTGTLALGDQVWLDADDDGVFEPEDGEAGIDGVRLELYLDVDGDGVPTVGELVATTTTATSGGVAGRYRFGGLSPGDYVVVVAPESFAGDGPLAGLVSSTGNDPAPDPDDDVNGDDNGRLLGALTASLAVTLTDNGEPTADDGDSDTNLTVDFGFTAAPAAAAAEHDYGDAPDLAAGSAPGDYQTTALDDGPSHVVGVPGAPFLGSCVDADGGLVQGPAADGDDLAASATVVGACAGGDDEDGVTFTGPFLPGGTASFSVTAGGPAPCALDAWVDWNRNGVFGDAGETIATALAVPPGAPTVLEPAVPAGALPGPTFARFRCSTAGGLLPTGPAADGEVEDHLVTVLGLDFGDAPASYGTVGAGAASHAVDPAAPLLLGACVDTEPDGQPDAAALGDDAAVGVFRVGHCVDDEDGVAFTSVLTACQTATVTVSAGAAGLLDAWLDFSGDGDFDDAGERVFSGQAVAAGANPLSFVVPCTAVEGTTFARFRLSSAGGLGPAGAAPDGEVEDHAVNIGAVDFGDAPDTYGTALASGGPNHRVVAGFSLGATVDSEPAGQPSPDAGGDGADEDGVTIPAPLTACSFANLTVTLTNTGGIATPRLDAWIDWDGDGAFDDPRDRVAAGVALAAGANALPVNVPCDAASAATFARFRLSSTGVGGPGGAAPDGEVEDYALVVLGLDFGDAPDPTYPTLLASNGARHQVLPAGNPTLGAAVDTEPNGQPDASLTGDDTAGAADDEDGVAFPAPLVPGATGTLRLTGGATGGTVSCWIDFNRNGSWSDAGEQVVADLALGGGAVADASFAVPVGAPQGAAAARCRISSQPGLGVSGLAPDGEVEDHAAPVGVEQPAIGLAKRLVAVERVSEDAPVFRVSFELRIENRGNVPLSGVNATAAFSSVFTPPASWALLSLTSPGLTVNPAFDGTADVDLLAPGNTLAPGAAGIVEVVLEVDAGGDSGPYLCSSVARGTSPAGAMVSDVSQDGALADADGDGDAGDDAAPTPVLLPISVIEVPTLSNVALALLAALLAAAGLARTRRRGGEAGPPTSPAR